MGMPTAQIWANAPTPFEYGPSDSAVSLDGKILIFGSEGWGPDGFSRQGGGKLATTMKCNWSPCRHI